MRVLYSFLIILILSCSQNEKSEKGQLQLTSNNELSIKDFTVPIKIKPYFENEDSITIKFNYNPGYEHYEFNKGIECQCKIDSNNYFVYLYAYNDHIHTTTLLAYIIENKYGLWVGYSKDYENIYAFNKIIEKYDINLKSVNEVLNLAKFYIRLSSDGNLRYIYLNKIQDIWMLTQYYNSANVKWFIDDFTKINDYYSHDYLSIESKYISTKPDEFEDYEDIFTDYEKIVHKPNVQILDDKYIVILFIWNQFSGNLEKWSMKFKNNSHILSINRELLKEKVGHIRQKYLMTFPDEVKKESQYENIPKPPNN